MEIFKEIKNTNKRYYISNLGRVKSFARGKEKFLKNNLHRTGYYYVFLNKRPNKIHRLVAAYFIENKDNKTEVNHIDGDKLNNSINNLEWVTHRENMIHAYNTGLLKNNSPTRNIFSQKGQQHPNAKLTDEDVVEIRTLHKNGVGFGEILKQYSNFSRGCIGKVVYYGAWKHIKI
jgi:hypothetical protein